MQKLVDRNNYLNQLEEFVGKPMAKIILGIRRSGKSTLMKIISESAPEKTNIIRIDFELLSNEQYAESHILEEHIKSQLSKELDNMVFIDEIQIVSGWEKTITSLVNETGCDIYVSGSNSTMLSSEYRTRIGGRYKSIEVRPLSYSECVDFCDSNGLNYSPSELFDRFLRLGGFPSLWIYDYSEAGAYSLLRDIYYSIVKNDVIDRYGDNGKLVDRIVRYLSDNVGSVTSLNNMYNQIKKEYGNIPIQKFYDYVKHLESAYFIERAYVYEIVGKKILSPRYKFYLTDSGLKHALIGYRKNDIAKLLENLIYNELRVRGYQVCVGQLPKGEVDFVAIKEDRKIYIRSVYRLTEDNMEREFGNLEIIKDQYPKFVVTMDSDWEWGDIRGIKYRHITKFLLSDEF